MYLVETISDMVCSWRSGNGFLAGSGRHGPCGMLLTHLSAETRKYDNPLLFACQHLQAVLSSNLSCCMGCLCSCHFLDTTPHMLQAASKQQHQQMTNTDRHMLFTFFVKICLCDVKAIIALCVCRPMELYAQSSARRQHCAF